LGIRKIPSAVCAAHHHGGQGGGKTGDTFANSNIRGRVGLSYARLVSSQQKKMHQMQAIALRTVTIGCGDCQLFAVPLRSTGFR
jgi:hypothetical protein